MTGCKVAIIGANGYAGIELAQLVVAHPHIDLAAVYTRMPDWQIGQELPELGQHHVAHYALQELEQSCEQFDLFFLATPPDISMHCVSLLLAKNKTVIDLSGAFRLDSQQFAQWYQADHTATDYIEQACYGLCPWWVKQPLQKSYQLIANPGCYATCALMALLPLLQFNIIKSDNIIIDAKSGVSGAGKKVAEELLQDKLIDNFYPYKVGKHQHLPEIQKYLYKFSDIDSQPMLITHLLPIQRGISMSIYAQAAMTGYSDKELLNRISLAYSSAYYNYPLIKFAAINSNNDYQEMLTLKGIVGSVGTQISYYVENGKIIIFACIDNLLKGAASQAIENLNALLNLPLATGLIESGGVA